MQNYFFFRFLIYLKLFGKHFTDTASIVTKSFWKSIGIGFLVVIGLVPGFLILLVTVIGIPLAGLVFTLLMLYFYLAKIVVGLAYGTWLSEKFNWKIPTFGSFAIGLAIIFILKLIPVVGFFVGTVVFLGWLGALTLQVFSKPQASK